MTSDRERGAGIKWAVLFWAAVLGFPPAVASGEYYSWIDPSGTMVLTNDPSTIPPASKRSQVAVHHYEDSQTSAAPPAPAAPSPPEASSVSHPASAVTAPVGLDMPRILLDSPDPSFQSQYNWVPLASPIYLGSGTLSGFWCLRTVAAPLQVFKQYLQGQGWSGQGSQMMSGRYPWSYGYGRQYRRFWGGRQSWGSRGYGNTQGYGNAGSVYSQTLGEIQGMQAQVGSQLNSGHPVYDQVMLERQAMNQQLSARFGAGMQTHPHCCVGGFGPAGGRHR